MLKTSSVEILRKRVLTSLQTIPRLTAWFEVCGYFFAFVAIACAVKPDLVDVSGRPSAQVWIEMAAIALFVPAIGEELVFRALLTPKFDWR